MFPLSGLVPVTGLSNAAPFGILLGGVRPGARTLAHSPKMIASDTETNNGDVWAALCPKFSKMEQNTIIWALNVTLRRVVALNGTPRQGRQISFKRPPESDSGK